MPVLHKSPSDSHYYIRASHLGRRMTLQLTPEGVHYLTASLGLREGDDLGPDVVEFLQEKQWSYTNGGGLGEEVDGLGGRGGVNGGSSPSQSWSPGPDVRNPGRHRERPAFSIRMEAYDHTILDQSAREIIETAKRTGAVAHGPIPLPTRVERYTLVSGTSRRQIEVRTHKRIIDIKESTGPMIEALNKLSLPAGVDIRIKAVVDR